MKKKVEREAGDVFEYGGDLFKVVETKNADTCEGCSFDSRFVNCTNDELFGIRGECNNKHRSDSKDVLFKRVRLETGKSSS